MYSKFTYCVRACECVSERDSSCICVHPRGNTDRAEACWIYRSHPPLPSRCGHLELTPSILESHNMSTLFFLIIQHFMPSSPCPRAFWAIIILSYFHLRGPRHCNLEATDLDSLDLPNVWKMFLCLERNIF